MMSLLVFLVILFGLFGMVSTQYITQYRNAYYYWVKKDSYNIEEDKIEKDNKENCREMCSKVESFSREFCEITDLLFIIVSLLTFTLTIVITIICFEFYLLNLKFISFTDFSRTFEPETQLEIIKNCGVLILCLMIFVSIPWIKYLLKMSDSTSIDKKLFDLWWDCKCTRLKKSNASKQPHRLYEILDEKIKSGKISDYTPEEKELVKNLSTKRHLNESS